VISYRLASYATPLRTIPASQPGRYSQGDEAAPTQYLSLHPLGPFAELMRNHDLRTPEQIRAVQARTWALDVSLDGLLEIAFDSAEEYGIAAEELVGDDRSACQALAGRLRGEAPGLIVPSAALPGTRNVVLFGARVAAPYLTEPASSLDIPASITAQDGRPLSSLVDALCFKDDSHPALRAWSRGEEFRFEEPDWAIRDRA
jgi:hypothetical protein